MNAAQLPGDLAALEARLRERAPVAPPEALRVRVLGGLARERARERRVRWVRVAAAAMVVLALGRLPRSERSNAIPPRAPAAVELELCARLDIDGSLARSLDLSGLPRLARPIGSRGGL